MSAPSLAPALPSATPLLRADIAEKTFGPRTVLRDVTLDVAEGEIVVLVGPSGCGKSTLLRIVAGLERGYEGRLSFAGRPLAGRSRGIGFIFQEPRLLPWLSVADNIAFSAGGAKPGDPLVERLLADVGLAGYGPALPKALSGGQAQRAAIARGLYSKPRLLLLDEPFSAVDAFTRMKLQDLLVDIARAHGVTLVLVTHDVDEAIYLADQVLVMEADPGRIRARIHVSAPRPRDRRDAGLASLKAEVLTQLYAAHAI